MLKTLLFNSQTDWFSDKKASCLTSGLDLSHMYIKGLVKSIFFKDTL